MRLTREEQLVRVTIRDVKTGKSKTFTIRDATLDECFTEFRNLVKKRAKYVHN